MTDYMPKVGDRVRATLGESVLVGIVTDAGNASDNSWIDLKIHDDAFDLQLWYSDGWRFEQVVEVPSKFGAVIKIHRNVPFRLVRVEENQWRSIPSGALHYTDAEVRDMEWTIE